MEPFKIATHRQLSILHPIYLLLIPHFNFKARQALINASGIITTGNGWTEHLECIEAMGDRLRRHFLHASVRDGTELQAWWQEIVSVGHADKKVGWTDMKTKANLIEALTTMIWIPSYHHNFGQCAYARFPVNRPTIAHKLNPDEDTEEYKQLQRNGEKFYLSSFSAKAEADDNH
ncbi:hypothetical protein SELMODRAFT_429044 [Selaginella moellendorffii]|uniref:Lipoxygenase domain-containing protein n=1 Tax=Selaginella moellendorffii TaxID=88036 RepID=D8T4V9_SELML|nr:hypothetical protein SELMODRAFT_429044 [Selaginella moellendorffii]